MTIIEDLGFNCFKTDTGEIIVKIAENLYIDANGKLVVNLEAILDYLISEWSWMIERVPLNESI